jgi:UDP-N-acetylglucosamine transferase subunit ALG13
MIFITTGTQFSFDRLLLLLDKWSIQNPRVKIIAQIGNSKLKFKYIETFDYLSPTTYKSLIEKATVIVGHAGTGTIITAKKNKIPAIIMAREFKLNEHRNEHQVSTVAQLNNIRGIYIANNETELFKLLDNSNNLNKPSDDISDKRIQLLNYLRSNIFDD